MARLIDAEAFEVISLQGKSKEFCDGVIWMLGQIDKTPTAYDIDKIVEELESIECASGAYERKCWLDKAIEIVKRGGKE